MKLLSHPNGDILHIPYFQPPLPPLLKRLNPNPTKILGIFGMILEDIRIGEYIHYIFSCSKNDLGRHKENHGRLYNLNGYLLLLPV